MKFKQPITRDLFLKDGFGKELLQEMDSAVAGGTGGNFRYMVEALIRSQLWSACDTKVFDIIGFEFYLRLRRIYEGRRLDHIQQDMDDRIVEAVATEISSRHSR